MIENPQFELETGDPAFDLPKLGFFHRVWQGNFPNLDFSPRLGINLTILPTLTVDNNLNHL